MRKKEGEKAKAQNNSLEIINEENEDEDVNDRNTVMSDITMKTANSINKMVSSTPELKNDSRNRNCEMTPLESETKGERKTGDLELKGKTSDRMPREINSAIARTIIK